jgi:hypothetical protein
MEKPIVVYYLHYFDEEQREPAFSKWKDFSVCVMAKTQEEAIEKAKRISGNPNIKIMGLASGREEWVDETKPLGTGDEIMPLGGWNKQNTKS